MGSNVNNATSEGHKGVVFESKDIVTKTKAGQKKEYFVKFKEKTFGQKFLDWFNKHKKKILIIICVVAVAAIGVVVTLKIIENVNQPPAIVTDEGDLNAEIDKLYDEIYAKAQSSDSDTPYTDAENYYLDLLNNEEDQKKKFNISIALGRYFVSQEEYDRALEIVRSTSWEMTDTQQYIYYSTIRSIYYASGDEENVELYDSLTEAAREKILGEGEQQ